MRSTHFPVTYGYEFAFAECEAQKSTGAAARQEHVPSLFHGVASAPLSESGSPFDAQRIRASLVG